MYDVSLYGHLTIDRVLTGFEMDNTLGSIANVWKELVTVNQSLKIDLQPTEIGEALIYVNKEKSERTSAVNLNFKSKKPIIYDSRWSHVLYINQLKDIDFIRNLGEWGIPFSLVFTKLDKLSSSAFGKNQAAFKKKMLQDWENIPPMHLTSAETALGRVELIESIRKLTLELSPLLLEEINNSERSIE